MHRSTDRILTTHVGSLPRPADLYAMIEQKQEGGAIDSAAFDARVKSAVAEIVKRQADAGIDV
jgi:5-methyltetrahydropteroyltriglutamate--homocysteine methyltransferase